MNESVLPLHWSTRALERVAEILDYRARYNGGRAEQWVEALFERVEQLARFPRMGRVVPEVGREEIREVFHDQHRVIYRITTERVEILTVRHMKQRFDPDELE